ncbi:MAG: DUF938 domain-containing protein [Gammaproteobacteria bacterium]|nr:DUF938 domain-containing protein [Gammaproteobacteria bacterium]
MEKPFSQACENNKEPILGLIRTEFASCRSVLEIGSGTGQHAVHFAAGMPWLEWCAADRGENHPGIRAWLADAALPNLHGPLELDVNERWPEGPFDAVFSANTFHIMSWEEVERCIAGMAAVTGERARVAVYGPFKVTGEFTSDSNAAFDANLRERDSRMGIRDIEQVEREFERHGLVLHGDFAMPANNRLLFFRREAANHE